MFLYPEISQFRAWRGSCFTSGMLKRLARLFVIKNKFEAFLVIYALANGAVERGFHYQRMYPGWGGWLLFLACPIAVVMAGGRILDSVDREFREQC